MSVSLGVYMGKRHVPSESTMLFDYPIPFRDENKAEWEKAAEKLELKIFKVCAAFDIDDIPQAVSELNSIHDWAMENKVPDWEGIAERSLELKGILIGFRYGLQGRKLENYWFDVG